MAIGTRERHRSRGTWHRAARTAHPDVVVLTAMPLELAAVHEHLRSVRQDRLPSGTIFVIGRLAGTGCEVALGLSGKGNRPTAVITERAVGRYAPAVVLFVGIAGAMRDTVALGDVVVGTHVHAYHGGRDDDDGFKIYPRTWEASHDLVQRSVQVALSGSWTGRLLERPDDPPAVHFGPILAGEIVRNSRVSATAVATRAAYGDALATDMESAGFAQAVLLNPTVRALAIRGVSDRADGGKEECDVRGWQPRAARNAAAFAVALVADFLTSG